MKAILALLVGCVWGWRIDLRRATTDPQDLYMSPGDNVDFVLNGESKQGTKWFYYLTNNLIIRFTGQDYSFMPHSSDPEMDNGGTYTIVLSLVATETP